MIDKLKNRTVRLLRWSEKYTKTDMVYLAKGGFWITFGRGISSIIGFGLAVAFANLLPPQDYGTYKYVLSILGIVGISTLPSINTALARSVARGHEGSWKPAVKTRIKWSLIGSMILGGIALYYYLSANNGLAYIFILAAAFFPFLDTLSSYSYIFQGRKEFHKSTAYNMAFRIATFLAMIITLVITENVLLVLFAYFASHSIARTILFLCMIKTERLNKELDKETVSYGKHLSAMDLIGTVANQIDKILVWHLLGAAPLAIYSFAMAPVDQGKSLLKSLNPLAFPKLANKETHVLQKTLPGKVLKFTFLTLVLAGLYALLAPFLFGLFFPQYLESIPFTQLYALGFIFAPLSIFSTTLAAQAQKKPLYILKTVGAVAKIALLAVLIPLFHITGAILAVLIPSLLSSGIAYYYFQTKK